MVAATSADRSEIRAFGDKARMINATLPFNGGPVEAARPFVVGDRAADASRALLCLTQAIYYEAGFEPMAGRRAVAQVVLNRLRHPAFPKSVCGVVYQGAGSAVCQFTFVCDGSLYRPPSLGAWREAREIARSALDGHVEKAVGAATHYHADYVSPRWAPALAKITQLGAHIFYRWPGSWGRQSAFVGRYVGEPFDPASLRPPRKEELAATSDDQVVTGPITDGTLIRRAPNDVGGLLDTSKGWKLSIPTPEETQSAAARAIAQQQGQAPGSALPAGKGAAGAVAAVASR